MTGVLSSLPVADVRCSSVAGGDLTLLPPPQGPSNLLPPGRTALRGPTAEDLCGHRHLLLQTRERVPVSSVERLKQGEQTHSWSDLSWGSREVYSVINSQGWGGADEELLRHTSPFLSLEEVRLRLFETLYGTPQEPGRGGPVVVSEGFLWECIHCSHSRFLKSSPSEPRTPSDQGPYTVPGLRHFMDQLKQNATEVPELLPKVDLSGSDLRDEVDPKEDDVSQVEAEPSQV